VPELLLTFPVSLVFIAVFAVLFAGFVGGLLGIGGGTLLVPLYTFVLLSIELEPAIATQVAVATSLATIVLLSAGGISTHIRKNVFSLGAVATLSLTGGISSWVTSRFLTVQIPGQILMAAFGVFCLFVSYRMFRGNSKTSQETIKHQSTSIPLVRYAPIGLLAGLISSLFGVGGGVVAVPLQVRAGIPMLQAVSNSAGMILVNASAGTVGFLSAMQPIALASHSLSNYVVGLVIWPVAIVSGIAAFATAKIGAHYAHAVNTLLLKRYFAMCLFLVGMIFVAKAATSST
jgi:uncharacterized membrane protein YfcA